MNISQFQITRLSVTDVTDTCKYPSPQEEESYKDNKVSLTAGRDEASLSFQQSGGETLWNIVVGCAEKCKTAHVNTQKEKKAARLPGENDTAQKSIISLILAN